MEALNRKIPPSAPRAWPVVTFTESVTFHLNGDEVQVIHVGPAHTDGDSIVHFKKANVIHTGDCFVNGNYPVIDYSSGGAIDGLLAAQTQILARSDAATKIIPGHGKVADKATLHKTHETLRAIRDAVAKAAEGKTLEQTIAQKPTARWDAEWGRGFVKADLLVTMIYKTLPGKR
jgi:glyoxylase-like metal-dependent hydrolase (beta-lactamase superfamily II)